MDTQGKPMKIIGLAIDCSNENKLADFYVKLLGWEKTYSGNGYAVISSSIYPSLLVFQAVDDYQKPIWPWEKEKQSQMMHLDFYVENLEKSVEYAISCGAIVSDVQYFGIEQGSVVMFDPEGHPFCLSTEWEEALYAK